MSFERLSSSVPSDEFLFLTDFFHHVCHLFMIKMIQEPNAALRRILFERNGITVDDFDDIINDSSQ